MRLSAIAALVVSALLVSGCSGGDATTTGDDALGSTDADSSVTVTAPSWAAPLLTRAGPEGAAIMASSDYATGRNRVSFLLVRDDNSLVRVPIADVFYKPDPDTATQRAPAKLVPIGVGMSAEPDEVKEIYVANLDLPRTGKQWIVIQPRGVAFQGFQILDVKEKPTAIAIGEKAPASNNPTTATTPAERITTARPPDAALLRYSVAESIEARLPFVVTFATPAFCESRTCGPTVEVVEAARKRYEKDGIRFIHVEIYEKNVPGNGVNRWVREWKLPTEPWVFVVDRNGIVRGRFEGAVSVDELTSSIRRDILR